MTVKKLPEHFIQHCLRVLFLLDFVLGIVAGIYRKYFVHLTDRRIY